MTNAAFWVEAFIIGLTTVLVGMVISYIAMGDKARKFEHWGGVAITFFLTGALTHILYQWTGWNTWYCKHGQACLPSANANANNSQ